MYRVNIQESSEIGDYGDTYMPPQWWINFEKYANKFVDWNAIFYGRLPNEIPEAPAFPVMRSMLKNIDAEIIQEGSYTLLFRDEIDFLAFKLKWS